MATLGQIGEAGFLDQVRRLAGPPGPDVVVGIGDDAAALRLPEGELLVATCDVLVEGRHFRGPDHPPRAIGRRLAAVNLSDIAAMGATPRWGLASFVLPPALSAEAGAELFAGLAEGLRADGAVVVGGNLSAGETLSLELTLLGSVASDQMVRRSGAQPGDRVLVTGTLGGSAAGRLAIEAGFDPTMPALAELLAAFRQPRSRVAAGRAIAASRLVHAMIDVSDGLLADLGHLCRAGGVGVRLRAGAVPLAETTREVAGRLGQAPLHLALTGGEDYELLLAAPRAAIGALVQSLEPLGMPVTSIGEVVAGEVSCTLVHEDGTEQPVPFAGWDHFTL